MIMLLQLFVQDKQELLMIMLFQLHTRDWIHKWHSFFLQFFEFVMTKTKILLHISIHNGLLTCLRMHVRMHKIFNLNDRIYVDISLVGFVKFRFMQNFLCKNPFNFFKQYNYS